MNQQLRAEYVRHRLNSAHSALDAAELLAANGHWNGALNRLYYAAFYAIKALLLQHEVDSKSHTGTRHQFSEPSF